MVRSGIVIYVALALSRAVTIATRYSVVRRQGQPEPGSVALCVYLSPPPFLLLLLLLLLLPFPLNLPSSLSLSHSFPPLLFKVSQFIVISILTLYTLVNHSSPETQIMDYQTQQLKVLPLIASAYALILTGQFMLRVHFESRAEIADGNLESLPEVSKQKKIK